MDLSPLVLKESVDISPITREKMNIKGLSSEQKHFIELIGRFEVALELSFQFMAWRCGQHITHQLQYEMLCDHVTEERFDILTRGIRSLTLLTFVGKMSSKSDPSTLYKFKDKLGEGWVYDNYIHHTLNLSYPSLLDSLHDTLMTDTLHATQAL